MFKKINVGLKKKLNHMSTCTLLCGNGQKNDTLAKDALGQIFG